MIFARDPFWRLLGAADMAALCAVCAASVHHLWLGGSVLAGALTLVLCALWLEKAFLLGKAAGSWFPARFGMNQAGVYEVVLPWAVASLFGVAVLVLFCVAELPDGDAVPFGLAAAALGRVAVPHAVMGWWSARKMARMPPSGE